jgi:hypothetical protein
MINIWSTPRTGSTWYTHYLSSLYPGSIVVNEIFNSLASPWYFKLNEFGYYEFYSRYVTGCFYEDVILVDRKIRVIREYKERPVVDESEIRRYKAMFLNRDTSVKLILHNHVTPIHDELYQFLTNIADENIFLDRKDKRKQLASLAIASASGKYTLHDETLITDEVVADVNEAALVKLIDSIKLWDKIPKVKSLSYEDIPFQPVQDKIMSVKINDNHFSRLSPEMIALIDKLVTQYENEKV